VSGRHVGPTEIFVANLLTQQCQSEVKFSWIPPDPRSDTTPPSWDPSPLFGDPARKLGDTLEVCSKVSLLQLQVCKNAYKIF